MGNREQWPDSGGVCLAFLIIGVGSVIVLAVMIIERVFGC